MGANARNRGAVVSGNMPSRRRKQFRWILAAMVLVVLVGMDFAARNLYLALRTAPHGRVYHPVYDHGYRPNFEWMDKYGTWRAKFYSNSLGFRDGSIRTITPRADHPRILFIGDSFTEGVGIPWEETFVGRLEADLKPQGVEVLNAGVMSYTPLLAKAKVRFLIEKEGLEFGRLVLFLDMSDIKDELFYREDEHGNARLIPYGPFASEAGWGTWVEHFGEFSENVIEPNFAVIGALSRNLKIHLRKITRKELGSRGAFTTLPDWILYWEKENAPNRDIARQGIEKLQRTLSELAAYLRGKNIPMTLVIYPWKEAVRPDGQETGVQAIWKAWAAREQVDLIDLFPVFAPCQPIADWFIPGDCHWNARGHALVAETLMKNPEKVLPKR